MSYEGPERRAHDNRISQIERKLDTIEQMMHDDRKERKELRQRMDIVLFGDGDAKKGLVTRMVESENAHRTHAKLAWAGITTAMGLAGASLWNLLTGHKGG